MPLRRTTALLFVLSALSTLVAFGCARSYDLAAPPSFRPYEDEHDVKLITPDGVMLKVREVENYPKASIEFWSDALHQHLERQGYVSKAKHCFKTKSGLDGCTAEFLLPYGAEDWVLSETLFVVDDTLFVVEAAGPYERYAKVEKELNQALTTFQLRN